MKKLFLLDAYALIYRAYYAFAHGRPMTAGGINTSAIFGFVNSLEDVLAKENPAYMAVCFDPAGGHTFRHDAYPEYKAQRDKQPEDITIAVPYIKDILEAYGIRTIEVEGYEADDVIGTLAHQADAEDFTTYMMTLDKDYGQLVRPRVLMYRPALRGQGFEVRGPEQVCERYGIERPEQVIDLLALEGDASDNVPGCPGVGEKTAAKLIAEWGSVEGLLEHTAHLKGALQKKVIENAEQIRFSKFLVTIKTDVPLPEGLTPELLLRAEPDYDRLAGIFRRLEFKSLLQRVQERRGVAAAAPPAVPGSLFDDEFASPQAPQPVAEPEIEPTAGVDFTVLHAAGAQAEFLAEIADAREVGLSVMAAGEDAMQARLLGIGLSTDKHNAYIPLSGFESEDRAVGELLAPLFGRQSTTIVSHDVKRDMVLLARMGVQWSAPWFDTALAHYLLSPESSHEISTLAATYLHHATADSSLTATQRKRYITADSAPQAGAERAMVARRLREPLQAELGKAELAELYRDVESPLIPVLAGMEIEGVRIDTAELAAISRQLTARVRDLEEKAYELAGTTFSVGSPKQVGEVLFERLKIDPAAKRTAGGSWSTAEDVLEKYAREWPIVALILEIRGLRKLLATYVDALPTLINPRTGKIHTTFNQTVTATGRISSSNPNLQNIPVRTDEGREIRRAFIADPGDLILSADYSQIELRLIADISGDEAMLEAFNAGHDIHRATAAKIFHEPLESVTADQRRQAKTANFGIIYGISAFGLAERLGIPRGEAKSLIHGYLATYPQVAQYMTDVVARARENGFVRTIYGRKRFLPDLNSRNHGLRSYAERNAINAPLQGSAADIIKIAMVRIAAEIERRGLASRMIMQVHDELIFNVKPSELAELQELVTTTMEGAYCGRVTLEVSSGTGSNWLEAH